MSFKPSRILLLALLVGLVGPLLAMRGAALDESGVVARTLAGRQVCIWRPTLEAGHAPLVLFSHSYHGSNTQSKALMQALAAAGYLVVAPNHQDALLHGFNPNMVHDAQFKDVDAWTDATYRDRADDLVEVAKAAAADPELGPLYDHSKVALVGHSVGGYTVLGLAGAWPTWITPDLKPMAVVALAPYCNPFLRHGTLAGLKAPVMYQGGSLDRGITPYLTKRHGAYDESPAPKYFVELSGADHFAWTNMRGAQAPQIAQYTVAFLDHYVKGSPPDPILTQLSNGEATIHYSSELGSSPNP